MEAVLFGVTEAVLFGVMEAVLFAIAEAMLLTVHETAQFTLATPRNTGPQTTYRRTMSDSRSDSDRSSPSLR